MTPILFDASAITFTTNGIGRLSDCISCTVTEERNGIFEVEFKYPITGAFYSEIQEGRIIVVSHDEDKDLQPFIIYRRSAPIEGVVTFDAHHLSYLLTGIVVSPFTASSVADAFNSISVNSMTTNPFTFWTDNTTGGTLNVKTPMSVRSLLGGVRGSILDVFGGEYDFDGFTVKNYAHRGANNGVTIRYGKNLMDLKQTINTDGLYDAVVPFWSNNADTVVYGGAIAGTGQTATRVSVLDLSRDFTEQPTVAQLEAKAQTVIDSRQPWIPKENIKLDFIALWQTEEYKNIAMLERVKLCDTVTVIYEALGVTATAKVIKVVWDALLERYDGIELGEAQSNFAQTITQSVQSQTEELLAGVPTTSMMNAAIDHATDLITGGLGGHIVFLYDANGKPTDMLIMDTEDVNTAVNVLRINVNGIGFSSTGVSGPYTSAWTLDGSFVADFITAGHLSCNRIKGGTLTLGGSGNGNGVVVVYDANWNEIGRWDKDGFYNEDGSTKHYFGTYSLKHYYINTSSPSSNLQNKTITVHGLAVERKPDGYNNVYGRYYYYDRDGTTLPELDIREEQIWPDYGNTTGEDIEHASIRTINSTSNAITCFMSILYYLGIHLTAYDSTSRMFKAEVYNGGAGIIFGTSGNGISALNTGSSQTVTGAKVTKSEFIVKLAGHRIYMNSSAFYYDGWQVATTGSSSKRYKHDIKELSDDELDANKLYDLKVKQFVFNDDHLQYKDMAGQALPGFIAEDVAEIYPVAVIHDADGNIENWDERRIIPGMLKLIQEQKQQIDEQQKQIDSLTERLAKLEALMGV